ncbi:centriole, cilia and spindle-associated protein-like [Glandiceps talaboti]
MVFKRTEYSREYSGPQWNQHYSHYKEKVDYRLQRRHLEHYHQPFEWESDEEEEVEVDAARPRSAPPYQRRQKQDVYAEPSKPAQYQQQYNDQEVKSAAGEQHNHRVHTNYNSNNSNQPPQPQELKLERRAKPKRPRPKSAKPTTGILKGKKEPQKQKPRVPLHHPPFLAFGWADRERITGTQRTHNVKAAVADSQFIYPAALRARKRQELDVVRQKEILERENYRRKRERALFNAAATSEPSQWQTEYRRQFSADQAKRC